MQSARLALQDCTVEGNKGAGLDASGSSAAAVTGAGRRGGEKQANQLCMRCMQCLVMGWSSSFLVQSNAVKSHACNVWQHLLAYGYVALTPGRPFVADAWLTVHWC